MNEIQELINGVRTLECTLRSLEQSKDEKAIQFSWNEVCAQWLICERRAKTLSDLMRDQGF